MSPTQQDHSSLLANTFLERLAQRPLPSWPARILITLAFTTVFILIRGVLLGVFDHVVGFSLLIPAVMLAGLACGYATSFLTVIFCIFGLWLIGALSGHPHPQGPFIGPVISFAIIGSLSGVIGASLRHSVRRLSVAHDQMVHLMREQDRLATEQQAVLDQSSVAIVRNAFDGTILDANECFARIAGRPRDWLIGRNLADITHPDDIEGLKATLVDTQTSDKAPWLAEVRCMRPDGSFTRLMTEARPLSHADGTRYGLIAIGVDISAVREAQAALSASQHSFHTVANSIPVMLWLTDNELTGTFFNRAYKDFVGDEDIQLRVHDWRRHIHPDDYDRTARDFWNGIESNAPFTILARYRRHDGAWRWLRSFHQPHVDIDGNRVGLIGTAYDVTDTQEATTLVQESEARFRTIADSAPALIWMVDKNGNTEFGNRRFRSTFAGQPPKRLISAIREWTPVEERDTLDKVLTTATREERRFSYLGRVNHPTFGTRWLRTEGAPRYDVHGTLVGFTGVSIDVSESQRAERDLKRINELLEERVTAALAEKAKAEAELVRSHRLEAIGRLTGGVAHDFNNLLTVIMGGLDIILRTEDPARRQKMAEAALAAARRGERLTGQLLAFSRRQTLRPSSTDINALMREGEPLLHQAVGDGMTLRFKLRKGETPALVDSGKFEAALINLLVNARDACPPTGRITVETAEYIVPAPRDPQLPLGDQPGPEATPAAIHPADLMPGRYVRVTVADNGTGMSEEVQKRVFEPFFTTKGVGHGTGLGLSQVYGFTRQSGGSTSIQSQEGKGTRINLFLPWASAENTAAIASHANGVANDVEAVVRDHRNPLKILLVEDDDAVATVALSVLQGEGLAVERVASATAALKKLSMNAYDVLLSDILMPGGLSGIELAQRASEEWPTMRVILSSGFPGEAEALRDTTWAFLPKPYTPAQLRALIGADLPRDDVQPSQREQGSES
ncbi:PAS domain-containing sensor histidine kinase [uncultured Brevundimonas sp.]|uniref:hybrid sensor histidine kinase/response regulator n=1 Tax=uncultured Brevundimonas sp. TaxID=213418 RepID=UPI002638678B|nr:PAS domain-containing sensor histidine kinase [uncultured Brevundimonas sp.]